MVHSLFYIIRCSAQKSPDAGSGSAVISVRKSSVSQGKGVCMRNLPHMSTGCHGNLVALRNSFCSTSVDITFIIHDHLVSAVFFAIIL